ncbi:U32 family peptidase [[Clostridium] colinum]|uniref:U32 family peptidase n=1 Tax=[Clostridium] colinum TaxID=36835 RepID=UPI002023DD52|nr:U32 family peptidase [[Clostridium] colinum]
MNNKRVELLSPVGSMESMISAVNNGCDAIYLGGKSFNARQSANNFNDEELNYIIDYCHLRGVKVNLTLNILYKEEEVQNVLNFVSNVYSYGIDAIIVQDIGIFNLIRNNFKNVALHASTQMTIHNIEGVKFLQDLGFNRVVLSRELTLKEIENITHNTDIEIEAFVHGAICVSYSGRCLMSSLIGERSGNRGRCAQPCRMEYKLIKNDKIYANDYLLSPKDTSTLPIIDKLVKSGIHTFKIEGRMKSPEYVASVTSNYRKYIDKVNNNTFDEIENNDLKELTQIFNRGGSSITGYYEKWSNKSMISPSPKSSGLEIGIVESYNKKTKKCVIKLNEPVVCGDGIEIWTRTKPHCGTNISKQAGVGDLINLTICGNINKGDLVFRSFDKALDNKLKKLYSKDTRKQEIKVDVIAKLNKPLTLKLYVNNIEIIEEGYVVEQAKNSCVTEDTLIEKLSKTGDTPFYFIFNSIDVDENIYIPLSAINALRRNATENLQEKIIKSFKRKKINVEYIPKVKVANNKYLTTLVQNKEQFDACIETNLIKRIYVELNQDNLNNLNYYIENSHKNNIEIYIALLWILREPMAEDFYNMLSILEQSNIDGYLLRNYINLNTNKKVIADYTFNIFNNASIDKLLSLFNTVTLSPELNISEIKSLTSENTEILVYGKLPLMTTHQCPVGLYVGNKGNNRFCKMKNNCDSFYLKDRTGACFPIKNDCFNCVTTIINKSPLFVLNKYEEINKLSNQYFRISFVDENKEEIKNIITYYSKTLINKEHFNIKNSPFKNLDYTNGHFFRGVL